MNWINLILCCLISAGGFIAATYEVFANKFELPASNSFKRNGRATLMGGVVIFSIPIVSAFINPWWTVFIVFFAGWLFSQVGISIFKTHAQLLALLLMCIGLGWLIINLL
ncbi:MAG: hypothetical protein V4581_01390 [Bacteroidota bacterium]